MDWKLQIDGKKFEAIKQGRKRKLIVKPCGLEDEGEYKCTTKDDKTICSLTVERELISALIDYRSTVNLTAFSP